jgi:HEPN domain-containing protein
VAKKIARGSDPHHDEVCFHSQQCAEKYLKALLEELGQTVPRTHVLENLISMLVGYHQELGPLAMGAKFLTRFAVATRYPGENATKRQVTSALRWAERLRKAARAILNLPPRRKKPP